MEKIKWESKYSVQIEEIDNQHKKLIEIINHLIDEIQTYKTVSELGEIVKEMANYASLHFSTEEKYFDQFNYADSELHKNEHLDFNNKIENFTIKYLTSQNDDEKPFIELLMYLNTWLNNHILYEDKKYMECFHENGLK